MLVCLPTAFRVAEPLSAECTEYAAIVEPDADGQGARVTLSGWDVRDPVDARYRPASERPPRHVAWATHVAFVPEALRLGSLGEVALIGRGAEHSVVVLDATGTVVGDHPLASFLTGEPLRVAEARVRREERWYDEAALAHGYASEGRFALHGFAGVAFSRLPKHRGPTLFQGTMFVIGESVLFVRVGRQGYGWFDLAEGGLLSRDAPTRRPPMPKTEKPHKAP